MRHKRHAKACAMAASPFPHNIINIAEMKFKVATIILACAATATLSGCGQQHKAESTVKSFIAENIMTDDYTLMFTKLDSTRHVSDKAILSMRANADKGGMFKKGIKYGKTGKQYQYLRTKICLDNDTLDKTFYLVPGLTEVVAFK